VGPESLATGSGARLNGPRSFDGEDMGMQMIQDQIIITKRERKREVLPPEVK